MLEYHFWVIPKVSLKLVTTFIINICADRLFCHFRCWYSETNSPLAVSAYLVSKRSSMAQNLPMCWFQSYMLFSISPCHTIVYFSKLKLMNCALSVTHSKGGLWKTCQITNFSTLPIRWLHHRCCWGRFQLVPASAYIKHIHRHSR